MNILTPLRPSAWQDEAGLTPTFFLASISTGFIYIFKGLWHNIVLADSSSIQRLWIIPFDVVIYCLVFLTFISFAAWIKGGYDNLKELSEGGLIDGLVYGLVYGLVLGLTLILLGWTTGWLTELIDGLIVFLTSGLAIALLITLVGGNMEEFEIDYFEK